MTVGRGCLPSKEWSSKAFSDVTGEARQLDHLTFDVTIGFVSTAALCPTAQSNVSRIPKYLHDSLDDGRERREKARSDRW